MKKIIFISIITFTVSCSGTSKLTSVESKSSSKKVKISNKLEGGAQIKETPMKHNFVPLNDEDINNRKKSREY